jgi:hypothetical protein
MMAGKVCAVSGHRSNAAYFRRGILMLKRVCFVLAFAALALAGCGQTAVSAGPGAGAQAKSTFSPTTYYFPTATPTVSPNSGPVPIDCANQLAGQQNAVRTGDLVVQMAFALAYPSFKLPDNLPAAPYKMTSDMSGKIPPDPSVNPNLSLPSGGYWSTICNVSTSATHTLSSLSLRVESLTPYSGAVNEWNVCSTTYTRQNGPGGGGCGGGIADPNCLQATFPDSAGAGTITTLASTSCTQLALPQTLKPGMGYGFNLGISIGKDYGGNIGVAPPSNPGTYTFGLGISLDGAAPVYVPVPHQLLLDGSAHVWDGQSCTSPAMQALIPANDTAAYICLKG